MPTASQILSLIRSHYENDEMRFSTISLQIAAHEAKIGHTKLASDIQKVIDKSKFKQPILRPLNKEFDGLLLETIPEYCLSDLIVSNEILERIKRLLNEYIQVDKLRRHNLKNRRKILLAGHPGTGKTMTASVIANELGLPFYTILMDKLVTKYMGETSAKLRQTFEIIQSRKGVYLFDEFDAIGTNRGKDNDVGEMRRVLNSFLQFIEHDSSESIIVAATNNLDLLDHALFRRFDDVLHYHLPSDEEKVALLKNCLGKYNGSLNYTKIANSLTGLSHAEISQVCMDAIKECVLSDRQKIDKELLDQMIENRKSAYKK